MTSALDIEESSRIDVKNGQTLIVISAPFRNEFKTNGINLNSDTKKSTICLQLIYAVVTRYLKNLNTLKREIYI